MSNKYIELAYPIYEGMPIYPGLPEVKIGLQESLEQGDDWNGSILTMYLHAGTHVDAPWHYIGENAPGIDQIPIDRFFYKHPLLLDIVVKNKNELVSIEQIEAYGEEIYEADILIFNTHYYEKRKVDFMDYATGFPAVSPEAAEFIRLQLPNVKAVAIDTLSIENLAFGKSNGYLTHKIFLDPKRPNQTLLIYEDINAGLLEGKKLLCACSTPLRIVGRDASPCNLVVEVED